MSFSSKDGFLSNNPRIISVVAVFLLAFLASLLLCTSVNLASAQETADSKTSKSVPAVEQILRVGLSPELRMTCGVWSSTDFESNPNSFLSEDADQEISTDGSRVAMFRLYNKWTGEHFYTSSKSERDNIAKVGWVYEQIEWYAPTSEDFKPVYRLYNKYVEGGDHHYTTSAEEKDECVKAGWTYEGEGWRTVEKGATDYVKVLRQYNPYGTTGTHNYTTDEDEQKYLVSLGWKAEADGGWGGYSTLEPSKTAIDFTKATVDTADKTYTGSQIKPNATIAGLVAGTDYVVTYGENVNVGEGTITISGTGKYSGEKTYTFEIVAQAIDFTKAVVDTENKTYNAQKFTPNATIANLKVNEDYVVSYGENKNAGQGTITITGNGNYLGSKTYTFTINKKPVTSVTWSQTEFVYNGKEQSPTATAIGICAGDVAKVEVSGSRKDAGTFVATVESIDNANYEIDDSLHADCTISQKELTVKWGGTEFTYDGEEHLPEVTLVGVVDGEKVVVSIEGAQTNASDDPYIATLGELAYPNYCYAGDAEKTKEFTISPCDISESAVVTLEQNDFVYDGVTKVQGVTSVVVGKFTLTEDTDYLLRDNTATNAGEHTLKIFGTGNFKGEATATFSIAQKDISNATITLKDQTLTYNGEEQTQEIASVQVDSLYLSDYDYELSGNKETDAGTYYLKVQGKTNYTGYKTTEFKIEKKEIEVSDVAADDKTYDGTADATGTATFSGVVEKDAGKVQVVVSGTFASTDASASKINADMQVTGISGDASKNYTLKATFTKTVQASILTAVHFNTNCKLELDVVGCAVNSALGADKDPSADLTTKRDDAGVTLEGWYSNEACTDGSSVYGAATENKKWDFDVNVVAGNEVTLYANWVISAADGGDAQKYWIQPSYKVTTGNTDSTVDKNNDGYVKDGWNVRKSSKDIANDVKAIQDGDATTIAEYEAFLENDNYHLFTKWNGSQAEYGEASDTTHAENQYVEFRILEVGNHDDGNGNGDVLTFQATHMLPVAAKLASSNSNSGGWKSTNLYSSLNSSSGSIASSFNSGFISAIKSVTKKSTTGSKSKTTSVSTNSLWVASRVEMSSVTYAGFKDEGKQYAYYASKDINDVSVNPCLARKTRAGATPSSSTTKLSGWWERSPRTMDRDSFLYVKDNGTPKDVYGASQYLGVVPCFCF